MNANNVKVSDLNGVGKKLTETLNSQGIFTAKDILLSLPYRYDEYRPMSLYEAENSISACLSGRIVSQISLQHYRTHLSSISFNITTSGQLVKVMVFNRVFLKNVLRPGMTVKVSGKYNKYRKEILVSNIFIGDSKTHIESKYRIKDVPAKTIANIVNGAIEMGIKVDEYLPSYCLEKENFLEINEMIKELHNPSSMDNISNAQRRKKYEEILEFYIRLNHFASLRKKEVRNPINYDINKVKELIKTIPFELTTDQKEVVNQVFRDFKSNIPANRMIQGDVGSGKTVVSLIASYAIVTSGAQVALMAPTEILATQHYEYFKEMLEPFGVNVSLFTGSVKTKDRKELLNNLENGNIDVIIGTHTLFSDDVKYKNLGLAIIDEQHRFGVNARNKLLNNGSNVDALYLTATPIPRSLALTIFNDLDISTIKTVRNDKLPIKTRALTIENLDEVFNALNKELSLGHQAYFVTSAIESEDNNRFDIKEVKSLIEQNCPNAKVEIMHGRLKDKEKDEIMCRFNNKEIDVLVSTTVIEVGISVDNATMITIMDAENFGLATLHQLRGRVGRGSLQGYCYLVTSDLDIERIKTLENSNDGFYLAEMDLKTRGPGEYFGMRQSGMSDFVFASYDIDIELFRRIDNDAKYLLENSFNPDNKKYIQKVLNDLSFSNILN